MVIFRLKKDKKEEPRVQDVPDELPSLDSHDFSPPTPSMPAAAAQAPVEELPQLETAEPLTLTAPAAIPTLGAEQPAAAANPERPKKLIDHINQIDTLREQVDTTEQEIVHIREQLMEKQRLVSSLRAELMTELQIVKSELGLVADFEVKKKTSPATNVSPGSRAELIAPWDKYFHFADGTVVRSVSELAKKLDSIPDEVFSHHCTGERNDFYLWIQGVFPASGIASRIQAVISRREMARILFDSIVS